MEWCVAANLIDYPDAVAAMENRVAAIREGTKAEQVWLLEHPPVYTGGTSAAPADLLNAQFPVFQTGRGGQYTYHGPGQRVAYVMLDLKIREADVRRHVWNLEQWIILTLQEFGVAGMRREGRVGIWVDLQTYGRFGEAKIAAIGVRVRRWVTYHGIAINNNPDLSHFGGIVPCGLAQFGVTSLADLGIDVKMAELDATLQKEWSVVFGN